LIYSKRTARLLGFAGIENLPAAGNGADMTSETAKALLMSLIFGGIEAALRISKLWKLRLSASLGGAIARLRSETGMTNHALQPVVVRRRSDQRRPLR
jgi:hypothetical protein